MQLVISFAPESRSRRRGISILRLRRPPLSPRHPRDQIHSIQIRHIQVHILKEKHDENVPGK
jgi:hypothetical protein